MARKFGSKNKTTIEREEKARLQAENASKVKEMEALALAAGVVVSKPITAKKLGKDILDDFANLFAGMAAFYQPWPVAAGKNPNENEGKFRMYAELATTTARDLAPFQSPRLSAVAIGAAMVNKIEISGGMPDDFRPPGDGKVIELTPGTVITADDPPAEKAGIAAA